MRIRCHQGRMSSTDSGFQVVERKGIGHPDSLADLVAEEFSRRYSLHALERFGVVPNHWVDKVSLVGAQTDVSYGYFELHKPVSAYLFGKVTTAVGGESIPVEGLFRAAVSKVLCEATKCSQISQSVRCFVENTAGIALDHPHAFYRPATAQDCEVRTAQANDTVFCSGYAPANFLDVLALDVENHLNSAKWNQAFPGLGSDVKVMLVLVDDQVEATVCLPVHPGYASSHQTYSALVSAAHEALAAVLALHPLVREHGWTTRLSVNTKDQGRGAYLAPFGTALGKGDCGLVGRGNRANGVISASGGAGVEALAGKNPIHHTGKLYTLAASLLAQRIYSKLGIDNEVVLVSRNGDLLEAPSFVGVRYPEGSAVPESGDVKELAVATLKDLPALSRRLLQLCPLERFRDPTLVLEV